MLKFLHLEDYRCFKDTTLEFEKLTIAVGKNNAGKSTIIEALRIISYALSKPIFRNIPDGLALDFPRKAKCINVNGKMLKINTGTIPHNYEEDAKPKLTAGFNGGYKIIVHFHDDLIFALVYDSNGKIITNKSNFNNSEFPKLNILPQIGPLRKNEKSLSKETVRKDKDTYLSSLHFRNEILLEMTNDDKVFNEFSSLIKQTWNNLEIHPPKCDDPLSDDPIVSLVVGENGFMTELGYVGNGLQMWLQMMWFVTKSKNQGITTIILDEPDVYMHPDLQRKLLKYVRRNFQQVIIATHSIEIISEVDPENILNVTNKQKKLKYTLNLPKLQGVVDEIGSIQNMSLIRLFTYKKLLFLEGNDMFLLKKFYEKLYPDSDFSIDNIFYEKIGGFSNLEKYNKVAELFSKIDSNISVI
ncbi:AAA family ATPase, partial [Streptococcus salivarius]